jgi:hypothetical protein
MPFLRQSTVKTIRFGPFLDATDGVTEEEALTITQALRRISKDGGAYAASAETGNSTHDSDGWYSDDFTAADTDTVGELILNVQDPATFLPVWMRWWVLDPDIFDALFGDSADGFDANGLVGVGSIANIAAPAAWVASFNDPSAAAISTAVWSETVRILTANTNFNDPTAAAISAAVWAETVRILTASTNFNDISTVQVKAQVDAGLSDIHLDHFFAVDYDPAAIPGDAGAWANELVEDDGNGLIRYTAKALENVPISGGGFVTGVWRWDTDITATDPGTGDVKGDNATLASITEIFISATTNNGFNSDEFLARLAPLDKLLIAREGGGGTDFLQMTVSGALTDNDGWWTIPVTVDDTGGAFSSNNSLTVTFGYQAATAAAIADAVWDENVVSAHGSADSAGLLLSEITKRSVTFSTAVVSGSVLGQMAYDGVAVFDRTTDSQQALGDGMADRFLARSIAGGSDGGRTIQDAFRAIRNRRAIVAGTLSVFEENDTTVAWTAAVTTTFGNPISEIDPA